jgi:hypothetical protein
MLIISKQPRASSAVRARIVHIVFLYLGIASVTTSTTFVPWLGFLGLAALTAIASPTAPDAMAAQDLKDRRGAGEGRPRQTSGLARPRPSAAARGANIQGPRRQWLGLTTPLGRGILAFLSALAEDERYRILARANGGRAAARKRGLKFGPKPKLAAHQQREAVTMIRQGQSLRAVALHYHVRHSTIVRVWSEPLADGCWDFRHSAFRLASPQGPRWSAALCWCPAMTPRHVMYLRLAV